MTNSKRKLTLNKRLLRTLLRTSWVGFIGCVLWGLAHPVSAAATKQRTLIQSIQVKQQGNQARLVLRGSQALIYSTFALNSPNRLVLDLQRADLRRAQGPLAYHNGPLLSIRSQAFRSSTLHITRLVMRLAAGTTWRIASQGKRLAIHFRAAKGQSQATRKARGNIISRTGIQRGLRGKRARRLLSVQVSRRGIALRTDGAVRAYEVIALRNPKRLVVDLHRMRRARVRSIRRALSSVSCTGSHFRRVRLGRHARKLRIVLDACRSGALPRYKIKLSRRGMVLRFAAATKTARRAVVQPQPRRVAQVTPKASGATTISDIGYGESARHSTILLRYTGNAPGLKTQKQGKTLILTIQNSGLNSRLQRSLDTSEFRGAVSHIQAYKRGANVQLVVALRRAVKHRIVRLKGQFKWQFDLPQRKQKRKPLLAGSYQIKYHPQQVGQAGVGQLGAGDLALMTRRSRRKKRYTGSRISIFFRKVEIHNLLRLFAEISGMNIITSDKVRGKVTLKLRNVPWDQALDLVLKTLKLGAEKSGNIYRIATLVELRREEEQRRRLQQIRLLAQPQKIRLIPVNYAKANQMAQKVKQVLSKRGKVSVDNRTNVLIVKDYVPFLLRAEGLVRSLDTQTPQVLIEARIVEANVNFAQDFGIQWGGHLLFSPLTGNSTGLQFPNPVGIRGGVPIIGGGGGGGQIQGTGEFGTPNYVINFPASNIGLGNGTALSFLFGSLSGVGNLHMRLSMAESTGNVKIISAPKIITLHKLSASIQQGLQIPFSSASAAGTNVQFVQANLSLTVLPQVTTDGSVFLNLNITNNAPDFSKGGAAGPAITTKQAQTNMLIKDGETMVIGGIYSRRTGSSQARIPFFSQIPVLGLLFKNYKYNDDRAELLVFVTPRIINRAQTLGGKKGS